MIAFGGTIGAGIFVSSGAGIASTGPAIVLSYLVVGVLAVIVMRVLGIMTVHNPDSGSFATHAGEAFGSPGRFAVGWMYWWLMVVTISVECGTAGSKMHDWVGVLSAPAWSLLFMAVLTVVNLAPVRVFGEFQFWLVLAKIVLVLIVPLLAVLGVLGVLPNASGSAAATLIFQNGLVPNGYGPVVATMLVAAFSFVGIEMTSIAAGETDRPRRVIPQAIRIVMYTVLGAYLLAMLMTVLLVPWNDPGVAASPFNAMMTALHIPAATTIINVVVLTAVLSVLSSCVYAASRIGYSLAGQHDAPKGWGRLTPSRVPRNAVLTSAIVGAVITILTYVVPNGIANALIDSSGAAGILTWIAIVLSYLKVRPRPESWQSIEHLSQSRTIFGAAVAAVALVVVLVGMLFVPSSQLQLLMTLLTVVVIFVVVMWRETNKRSDQDDWSR
ncbi:MAG TPA: amino acid permease [Pseudonocardiaceae bacterium]|jgi:L-asparagine transporter-like permease|nr:amino acid permease [Pseudonocardiaceae bacterium]